MITAYRPPDHIQVYFGKRFYPMGTTCIFLFLLAQLRGGLSVILHLSGAVNRSLKLGQLEFIGPSFYFKWHSCFLYHGYSAVPYRRSESQNELWNPAQSFKALPSHRCNWKATLVGLDTFNSKLTAHRLLGSLKTDRSQRVYKMADQNVIYSTKTRHTRGYMGCLLILIVTVCKSCIHSILVTQCSCFKYWLS